ncbi:MAG TPA: hypothetical protein ENG11_05325, partial [candidate division Zixibacteria bacterium]|nr:hypothetical protein [candidate division Zixibacteria bacterium]
MAVPFEYIETSLDDFADGDTVLISILSPDPDGTDDGALALSADDTIRVLQVYPDGHCRDCVARAIYSYMHAGTPSLNIKIEVVPLSAFNRISSASDSGQVYDPFTGAVAGTRCLMDYHIVMFGIANGYGGRHNDLSEGARAAVVEFALNGGGVMLTHDTIAKRRGWSLSEPLCPDPFNYEHPRFNSLTPITGLDAEWVSCFEPENIYTHVTRDAGADPSHPILHYPFELPAEFDVTQCHAFGEHFVAGQVWYRGPDGQIYMHSFHDPENDVFASYFSTGHQEEYEGEDFTPTEWETKGMINAMFYAFFGGRGNGVYTSSVIDAGCPVHLDSIIVNATLPGSTSVVLEVRYSDDGAAWSDWVEIPDGRALPAEVTHHRYFQYRLSLSRGLPTDDSPVVHWVGFFGEQDIPQAELILPAPNSFTACTCGVVEFLITTESELQLSGCRVRYDGTPYGDDRLEVRGDTLIFHPPECFEDGDTHTIAVGRLINAEGCVNEPEDSHTFFVDLSPPTIILISPPPDTAVGASFIIRAEVSDSISGVDPDSLTITVAGETITTFIFTDDTLTVPAPAVAHLGLGDSVEICIYAQDMVPSNQCGPNRTTLCWRVYVDTLGPAVECDSVFFACESLEVPIYVHDDVAVMRESTVVVLDGAEYLYPDGMRFEGDTLIFTPGVPAADGDTFEIQVFAQDIFGNEGESCAWQIVVDRTP